MYEHIFIDLDDTLWNTTLNSKETMRDVFFDYKFDLYYADFESFYTTYWDYNCHLWKLYRQGKIGKNTLIVERFLHPLRPFGIIDESFALRINNDFLEQTTHKKNLIPYALEILEYLHPKYHLHILSNGFEEVQYKKMKNSGLISFFDKIILSDDIGTNKPDPRIFEYAMQKTKAKTENSIMIGDSWEADIVGAKNSGINQIWFNPLKEQAEEFEPTHMIYCLSELKEIL